MLTQLPELGIDVYVGITTGTAYSGFVGSQSRREMCAMGRKFSCFTSTKVQILTPEALRYSYREHPQLVGQTLRLY